MTRELNINTDVPYLFHPYVFFHLCYYTQENHRKNTQHKLSYSISSHEIENRRARIYIKAVSGSQPSPVVFIKNRYLPIDFFIFFVLRKTTRTGWWISNFNGYLILLNFRKLKYYFFKFMQMRATLCSFNNNKASKRTKIF